MEIGKNFMKRGAMQQITWILHLTTLPELLNEYSTCVFETTDGEKFKTTLWTRQHSGDDYLFCTLSQVSDDEQAGVCYSVKCRTSIVPEGERQLWMDPVLVEVNSFYFRLLPLTHLRNYLDPYPSSEAAKLTVKFRVRRKLLMSMRVRGLRVTTSFESSTENGIFCFRNEMYDKKNECVLEDRNILSAEQIREELLKTRPYTLNVDHLEDKLNGWYQLHLKVNNRTRLYQLRFHALDINDHLHPFACPEMGEFREGRSEDLWKRKGIVCNDGELYLFAELSYCLAHHHVKWEWVCSSPSRRDVSNLRHDLKRLFQNSSMTSNVDIKAKGTVLKVHKDVIKARSPVFNAMLSHNMMEGQSNVVDIIELDSETLKNFLAYAYSGTFDDNMKWEETSKLYVTAHKYLVHSLCHVCSVKLAEGLSEENSGEILALSHLFHDKALQIAVADFKSLQAYNLISSGVCKHQITNCPGMSEKEMENLNETSEE